MVIMYNLIRYDPFLKNYFFILERERVGGRADGEGEDERESRSKSLLNTIPDTGLDPDPEIMTELNPRVSLN